MTKTKVSIMLTVLWVVIGLIIIFLKLDQVQAMKLNEIGDFLAGFFSPVAFLWLVVGYFQQGEELKLNTKALELQVSELRLSVEQQKELVEVTREDMALSKNAYEREAQKEIRRAQPIFQLTSNSYGNGPAGVTALEATLTNDGHDATSVTLSCNEGVVRETDIAVMLNGEKKIIRYDFAHAPTERFLTHIKYHDGLDTLRHQTILAIKNEQGNLTFLPPKNIQLENA